MANDVQQTAIKDRINKLTEEERKLLETRTEALYNECRAYDSDEFSFEQPINGKKKDVFPVETVVALVNDYHNVGKEISKIMEEKCLSHFQVISAICDYTFKQQGTVSRLVDLSNLIVYMGVHQSDVDLLITELLKEECPTTSSIFANCLCLPSSCLLWLSIIWMELKNPKMAALFDRNWGSFQYRKIDEEELKKVDDELEIIFDEYLNSNSVYVEDFTPKLVSYMESVKDVVESRRGVINDSVKNVKELDDVINKRPPLEVETILSDSSDSEASPTTPGNDEILVIMQKVSAKWLEIDLCQENFAEEIELVQHNFYFIRAYASVENRKFNEQFLMCRLMEIKNENDEELLHVKFMNSVSNSLEVAQRCDLAMGRAPGVRCPEGSRVIAQYKSNPSEAGVWLSGTVGAKPLLQNRFEYLIFFDNGIDYYVKPENVRLMIEQFIDPKTNRFQPRLGFTLVKSPTRKNFLQRYLLVFPDWPLIRLKKSKNTMRVLVLREHKEESAFVLDVDRQMCLLRFPHGTIGRDCVTVNCAEHEHIDEWIYRGNSDRFPTLQSSDTPSSGRLSTRRMGRNRSRYEIALPEYDYTLLNQNMSLLSTSFPPSSSHKAKVMQRAKKSNKRLTTEYENNVKGSDASTSSDLITRRKQSNRFKVVDLKPPDWRHIKYKAHKQCSSKCLLPMNKIHMLDEYSPCSPYFIPLVHGYTREYRHTRAYGGRGENSRQFVVYRAPCGRRLLNIEEIANYLQVTATESLTIDMFTFVPEIRPHVIVKPYCESIVLEKDYANGLEDVKIPVVNAVDNEKTPAMTYRARRFADSSMIDGSVQPQFCSGCSCTDNCSDPSKCECQQLTIESHDRLSASLRVTQDKTYKYRTLTEKVISGIYECNDMCSCSKKLCYNRVVQQNIKIPLELYMTAETGWGVRTLVDIPPGTFISTYSGRLLTDRMAELQGREVSDMYLAELDLHEVVEAEKEQQGIDLIDKDEGYDEPPGENDTAESDEGINASNEEGSTSQSDNGNPKEGVLADDVRRDANFNFDTYFGDNALFIVDAQESGNIGRFLNHSCEPNVFVNMVLVDTHDLRLPWIGFFSETLVKAGEELRWNYGYSPNSVPGKVLICKCGSQHCQGRLL